MPGLRLAFMTLPGMLIDPIQTAKYTSDIATSGFFQKAFQLFLDKGMWDKHTKMLREVYGKRHELMVQCLSSMKDTGITYDVPSGGLNFWITLPEGVNDRQIYDAAFKEKIIVAPGSPFYMNSPEHDHLRLGFSSADEDKIKRGMDLLEKVLNS